MNIVDLHDPQRINRAPDAVEVLVSLGNFVDQGFTVHTVELRLYLENIDEKLGPYSLITSFVNTDKGSVEMIYDEGYRGNDSLKRTVQFLASNLGISGIILRSIITLRDQIEKQKP
ncbi:MAG: hypothetical protein HC944_06970 [Nanoarchaeota archaeon]|nr:hypothetical protein [Nanoarchaeota archaeon]